ncbi:MAG: hypothetical protein DVB31_02960 [Verrucomicrobia bacterium]|nr:MAG: hypothetical protein DVB31_02960 [Verrucomicrobiota bacterium]
MSAVIGSLANKAKTTARVLYKRTGESAYVDLGNVLKFSRKPQIQRYTHMASQTGDAGGGFKRADGKLVTTIEDNFEFSLNDHTPDNLRLLLLGGAPTTADQALNATLAVSIASVKPGGVYWVGAYGITAEALTFDGDPKTPGTDYILDKASGILSILATGTIGEGDPVAGTVAVPAVKYNAHDAATALRATGSFEVFEFDQFSKAPRKHTSIASGELIVTNWGEQTVDQPNEFTIELLAITTPVTKERQD